MVDPDGIKSSKKRTFDDYDINYFKKDSEMKKVRDEHSLKISFDQKSSYYKEETSSKVISFPFQVGNHKNVNEDIKKIENKEDLKKENNINPNVFTDKMQLFRKETSSIDLKETLMEKKYSKDDLFIIKDSKQISHNVLKNLNTIKNTELTH